HSLRPYRRTQAAGLQPLVRPDALAKPVPRFLSVPGLVRVPGAPAEPPATDPGAGYASGSVRTGRLVAELRESENFRRGWHRQSDSRVLQASGTGIACDGARAHDVATAFTGPAPKYRCSPWLQITGVSGDHGDAPRQD